MFSLSLGSQTLGVLLDALDSQAEDRVDELIQSIFVVERATLAARGPAAHPYLQCPLRDLDGANDIANPLSKSPGTRILVPHRKFRHSQSHRHFDKVGTGRGLLWKIIVLIDFKSSSPLNRPTTSSLVIACLLETGKGDKNLTPSVYLPRLGIPNRRRAFLTSNVFSSPT